MPRRLIFFLFPAITFAAIWPDQLGPAKRASSQPVDAANSTLWREFGFQQAETARYDNFTATAWRFQDSTGATAAFQGHRPANSRPSNLTRLAVETADGVTLAHGNYLFRFEGYKPKPEELASLFDTLPKLEQSPLPPLMDYLPTENLVPNSERYIIGPASLAAFDSRISPSTAAFHLGAEAQAGAFRAPGGDMKLAIFSYPTPQLARERVQDFQKIPAAVAKRSGPLVAAIIAPPNPDEAQKLLSQIRYQAEITWSERMPTRRDNIGDLIINIFILIGILLVFCIIASFAFGGFMIWRRKTGRIQDAMIVLDLANRR